MEDLSKMAAEKKIDITEQMKDFSKNVQETFKNQSRWASYVMHMEMVPRQPFAPLSLLHLS